MRFWPFSKKRRQEQGEDLDDALRQADRAIADAQQLRCRAGDVADRWADTWARNHIAQAVANIMRGET
jgi:hypothetical protein